jgi:hypothetical protein
MALVTNITKTVSIPNETDTVVIRKLNHTQLKLAAKAKQSEGVGFMREMGGELLKALRDADTEKIKKIQEEQAADVENYDRDTLLRFGVVSWTYPIPPIGLEKSGVTNGLDELDEPTAKFLAKEIFEYSRPETVAEAKNV